MCRILDQITRINKPKMSQEFWQKIKEKLLKNGPARPLSSQNAPTWEGSSGPARANARKRISSAQTRLPRGGEVIKLCGMGRGVV